MKNNKTRKILRDPKHKFLFWALGVYFCFCFPIAYATSSVDQQEESTGTSTGNPLISINKDIQEIEDKKVQPKEKYAVDVTKIKADRDFLKNKSSNLEQENAKLKEQLENAQKALSEAKTQLTSKDAEIKRAKQVSYEANVTTGVSQSTVSSDQVKQTLTARATAYTAYCNGCSGITANGTDIRTTTPKVIAVDPRVIPLGTKVEVLYDGVSKGVYTAADTGGAIKGHKIDILVKSESEARQWGVRTVELRVLK